MFGLIGCQKDVTLDTQATINNVETPTKMKSLFDFEPATYNADVMQKIKAFETRLEEIKNGILPKNEVSMDVEDAIWNVEALMNFRYGRAQLPFDELQSQKAVIKIPLNKHGYIGGDDILTAVQSVQTELTNQFNLIRSDKKHVISVDLHTKAIKSRYLTLEIISAIGSTQDRAVLRESPTYPPFGTSDNWDARTANGRCHTGSGAGPDAPKWAGSQMLWKINRRAYNENEIFFTSVETKEIFSGTNLPSNPGGLGLLNPNDVTPNDNDRDFLLYSNFVGSPNGTAKICIDYTDMNWYFYNIQNIIIPAFNPIGKSFMTMTDYQQIGPPTIVIEHQITIQYGVKNFYTGPPVN